MINFKKCNSVLLLVFFHICGVFYMNYEQPQHFSSNYKIDLSSYPVKSTDRVSGMTLVPASIFSLMLISLGMYDLLNGYKTQNSVFDVLSTGQEYKSILSPIFFDVSIIILGFSIVCSFIFSYIRYKKIRYENNQFEIIHRPSIGPKIRLLENLEDYDCVLFRVETFKQGAAVKYKYIIELAHDEPSKTIPLYISDKNKKKKSQLLYMLEEFSKYFNKPIKVLNHGKFMELSSAGATKEAVDDIAEMEEKSLGIIPHNMSFSRDEQETVIIINKSILFRREKIVIKRNKLFIYHKGFLSYKKAYEIEKEDIKFIEIINEKFLIILSDKNDLFFEDCLTENNAKWIRNVLIRELF